MIRRIINRLRSLLAEPEPAPVQPATSLQAQWTPEGFLASLKAGSRCPFCAKEKTAGELTCGPCDKVRKPNVENRSPRRPTRKAS